MPRGPVIQCWGCMEVSYCRPEHYFDLKINALWIISFPFDKLTQLSKDNSRTIQESVNQTFYKYSIGRR